MYTTQLTIVCAERLHIARNKSENRTPYDKTHSQLIRYPCTGTEQSLTTSIVIKVLPVVNPYPRG